LTLRNRLFNTPTRYESHSYETGNNIIAEESGYIKTIGEGEERAEAIVQQGTFSYTSPEGQLITIHYTADETGFHAQGDHIPTPPPVSEEIQKGLDLIYAGIRQQEVLYPCDLSSSSANGRKTLAPLDPGGIRAATVAHIVHRVRVHSRFSVPDYPRPLTSVHLCAVDVIIRVILRGEDFRFATIDIGPTVSKPLSKEPFIYREINLKITRDGRRDGDDG